MSRVPGIQLVFRCGTGWFSNSASGGWLRLHLTFGRRARAYILRWRSRDGERDHSSLAAGDIMVYFWLTGDDIMSIFNFHCNSTQEVVAI